MRILLVHNYYQQAGGEGLVFEAEAELLKSHQHKVIKYTAHNDQLAPANPIKTASTMLWNRQAYKDIQHLIKRENIQVAHFHNTFPLISPSVYYATKAAGASVVQTLHNYRLLCPNALFLRDQTPCEDCLGKTIPWPGVVHKCYRNDRIASGAVTTLLAAHRLAKTWNHRVDAYIALSAFAKRKLIQGGLPENKIAIKPNFVAPDPGFEPQPGQYALFVGRLSVEKGIDVLLTAWKELGHLLPLKIVGDGPLAEKVAEVAKENENIEWLGRLPKESVYRQMKSARFLVFPSKWYEGLPRTIVESFAVGTPVLGANLGVMSSLIIPGRTGWHFRAGDTEDLIQCVKQLVNSGDDGFKLRETTRSEFETQYSAKANYLALLKIYQQIIDEKSHSVA